jgi:hypothetical protein
VRATLNTASVIDIQLYRLITDYEEYTAFDYTFRFQFVNENFFETLTPTVQLKPAMQRTRLVYNEDCARVGSGFTRKR